MATDEDRCELGIDSEWEGLVARPPDDDQPSGPNQSRSHDAEKKAREKGVE
jgi:hypothetical protein